MSNEGYIILGYHNVEASFALRLAADLRSYGVNLWLDRLDIRPQDDWDATLESALSAASAFLPVLSPDYVSSSYGRMELADIAAAARPIIPVLVRPVSAADWPPQIGYRQYIDMTEAHNSRSYEQALDRLVSMIRDLGLIQVTGFVNPEKRYINQLLVQIEQHKAQLEFVPLSYATYSQREALPQRPAPFFEASWGLNGPFILRYAPLSETRYLSDIRRAAFDYPLMVLLGSAGVGKTTALYRLMLDAIRAYQQDSRNEPLPFLVNLSAWEPQQSLADFLKAQWPLRSDVMEGILSGRTRLFIDGLDELGQASEQHLEELSQWLSGEKAPKQAIITADATLYPAVSRLRIPIVSLEDMTDSILQDAIDLCLGDEEGRIWYRTLVSEAPAWDWALRNRLYLRALLFVSLHAPDAPLPTTPSLLWLRVTELLWEREQLLQNPDWLPYADIMTRLTRLAFEMFQSNESASISTSFALTHLETQGALHTVLSAGLMRRQGTRLRFLHRRLQETLAAVKLGDEGIHAYLSRPGIDAEGRRLVRPWDAVIAAATALFEAPDALVASIADVDPYLALSCVTAGSRVTAPTREHIVSRLMHFATVENQSGLPAAAAALENLSDGDPLAPMLQLMRESGWDMRQTLTNLVQTINMPRSQDLVDALSEWNGAKSDEIAEALLSIGDEAVPHLLHMLLDEDASRRRGAVWALGVLRDSAASPALVTALNDADPLVRRDAAQALQRVRDASAVPSLILALQDETSLVRNAAANALAHMGASAVPELLRMMHNQDPNARRIAIGVLGRVGDMSALPDLVPCLQDEDSDVRAMAVTALGQIGHPASAPYLMRSLSDKHVPRWSKKSISEMAASALEQIGTEEAMSIISRFRQSRQNRSERSAAKAKQKLKQDAQLQVAEPPRNADYLRKALQDPDWQKRRRAVEALSYLDEAEALPGLMDALQDDDSQVRWAAVKALGTFSSPAVVDLLLYALRDNEYLVSATAADVLAKLGHAALPGLMAAAETENADVRGLAIEALGKIGDTAAIPILKAALVDHTVLQWEQKPVSEIAANALEKFAAPEAQAALREFYQEAEPVTKPAFDMPAGPVPDERPEADNIFERLMPLLDQLSDPNWRTRQRAAKSLSSYAQSLRGSRNTRLTEKIASVLLSEDSFVRWAAVEALAWIGDAASIPPLMQMLNDESWTVRIAVIRALAEIDESVAIPGIMNALDDKHELVREVAAEVLGHFADAQAVPALLDTLYDETNFVRRAAIQALGRIGDPQAIQPIIEALTSDDPQIVWSAVDSLGLLKAAEAVPALASHLENDYELPWNEESDMRLCDATAIALERIGTAEAQTLLEQWRKRSS